MGGKTQKKLSVVFIISLVHGTRHLGRKAGFFFFNGGSSKYFLCCLKCFNMYILFFIIKKFKLMTNSTFFQDSAQESVITRDIHRTFPAHDYFKDTGGDGQESLYKICKVGPSALFFSNFLFRAAFQECILKFFRFSFCLHFLFALCHCLSFTLTPPDPPY